MRRLSDIFLFLTVFLLTGCAEDFAEGGFVEREVSLSFSAAPVCRAVAGTKAIDEIIDEGLSPDYVISDFWVFQYDSNGTLIGKPMYYRTGGSASQDVSILLPSEAGTVYKTVFLANTHDNGLDMKIRYSSISELTSSALVVSSFSDTYMKGFDDLMMNGYVDVYSDTRQIECTLYRNVARLDVQIRNMEDSGITINSVQLKNVSNALYYADRFNDGLTGFPNPSSVTFMDFEKDDVSVAPGNTADLKYYLTRNMRGNAASGTEAEKNTSAPTYSSYIEVMATHDDRNTPVRYRFYLGKNNSDNFDVEPNFLYDVSLTFNAVGGEDDSRVEDLSVVQLADANSYVIQPIKGVGVKYTVPIKERINRFWQSDQGKVNQNWSNYILDGREEWIAEVIWQDAPGKQVLKFCQDDGTLTDVYTGDVDGDSFSIVLTDDAVGTPCNVLIGVRSAKSGWNVTADGYMWSWHIWITDYNPDTNVGGWSDGKYSYQVPGGALHKYSSFESIPMYNGKFIMDRNLGSHRADSYGGISQEDLRAVAGMYYEYGRKDPFPCNQLYDIRGNVLTFSDGTNTVDRYGIAIQPGPAAMHASVTKPYNYYWRNGDPGGVDWVVDNALVSYDWNDLNRAARDGEGKSFFDPCPPGWKLPHQLIFDALGGDKFVYASNCTDWVDLSLNADFNNYKGWLVYLSGEDGWNDRSGDVAYYPAVNNRVHSSGQMPSTLGSNGGLWTVNPLSNGNAYYLYFSNTADLLFSHPRGYFRYIGMPVRCIQE